jgi:hypothetical protein
MRETLEIRVPCKNAGRLFATGEVKSLGDPRMPGDRTCSATMRTDDPRFPRIGEFQREMRKHEGKPFFYGWEFRRSYSTSELNAAEIFHLWITAAFEPAGEQCGTIYDESTACPICAAGRTQISDLVLDLRKAPKSKHIARTIADEWIVSQWLAELLVNAGMTGFDFRPVHHKAKYDDDAIDLARYPSGRQLLSKAHEAGIERDTGTFMVWLNRPEQTERLKRARDEHVIAERGREKRRAVSPLPKWYQLVVTSNPVSIAEPTRFGIEPFDEDREGRHRCPLGHVSGLNVLSELSLDRSTWDGNDIARTRQSVGIRMGVLVPTPILLVSPRLRHLLTENKVRGYSTEVAHLV